MVGAELADYVIVFSLLRESVCVVVGVVGVVGVVAGG